MADDIIPVDLGLFQLGGFEKLQLRLDALAGPGFTDFRARAEGRSIFSPDSPVRSFDLKWSWADARNDEGYSAGDLTLGTASMVDQPAD